MMNEIMNLDFIVGTFTMNKINKLYQTLVYYKYDSYNLLLTMFF